jgi:tRNA G10  N-methylase Trm11
MPTKLFISGKNWTLSLAELAAYLQTREIGFKIEAFNREFFAIDTAERFEASAIWDLGGTIKIGDAKTTLQTATVKEAFLKKNKPAQKQIAEALAASGFAQGIKAADKVLFGVSVYCTDNTLNEDSMAIQRFIGSAVKGELAEAGKKANFIGFGKDRRLAQLSHVEVLKKGLVESQAELLFCVGKTQTYIATTAAVHNPFEFQKRDIYKPNQRTIFAMPPRLAKMLVNLSGCRAGKTLVDPFCGVGTVLQEALLEGASVVGLDVNAWCTEAAEENLEWLTREYKLENPDYRLLQGDVDRLAEKVGADMVDCVVSEPDLGPALREVPTTPYAQKIIQKLEPLFWRYVEQAFRVLKEGGKLVLVTPYFKTRSGEAVIMQIDEHTEQIGFRKIFAFNYNMFAADLQVGKLVGSGSLVEMDERHKVGREIRILQK